MKADSPPLELIEEWTEQSSLVSTESKSQNEEFCTYVADTQKLEGFEDSAGSTRKISSPEYQRTGRWGLLKVCLWGPDSYMQDFLVSLASLWGRQGYKPRSKASQATDTLGKAVPEPSCL